MPPGSQPLPASVPVLVVGGDLDSWTPLPDARALAPTLGANVRVVQIDNAVHTPAMDDTVRFGPVACASAVIRAFVEDPAALQTLDASCGAAVPPIHLPAGYPLRLADAPEAVAAAAVNDARMRWWLGSHEGLRGGSFTAHGNAVRDAPAARRPLRRGRHRQRERALGARDRFGDRRRGRTERYRPAHAGTPGVPRS